MKKLLKEIAFLALFAAVSLFFFKSLVYAWDATMTDEEIVEFLEKWSDEENLRKLAESRGWVAEEK